MQEIGSEFWDVPVVNKENTLFHHNTQWYLSGRHALKAIIKDLKKIRSVALPSWCCESMIKPFVDAGIEVHFYSVYWEDKLIQDVNLECDAILLMDYFGYTSSAVDIRNYNGIIIRDVTHSLFSCVHTDADYYFGSLRKWCGIWTGGYAWTQDGHYLVNSKATNTKYVSLRKRAMNEKADYIKGINCNKNYLHMFDKAERILDNDNSFDADNMDILKARFLDIDAIRKKRRSNAHILRNAFADMLVFPEMAEADCPLFVPVLVPNGKRDKLKEYLISRKIYCPVHWPKSEYHQLNGVDDSIYNDELSLVCDQRYDAKDMNRIVDAIKTFWKEA